MPYIKEDERKKLDPIIETLRQVLVNMQLDDESNNMECNMHYIITSLLSKVYTSMTYEEINDAVGMLECCKQEYYRKVAAIINDQAEYDNGEIPRSK